MEIAFPRDPAAESLLAELERRARSTPAVAAEWERARATWPGKAADARALSRFREWFLLEHSAASLGAPPAVAWAPAEIGTESEDPWARLLSSYYGIFRVVAGDASTLHLADLATGRALILIGASPLPSGTLLFARALPTADGAMALLPGWRVAPGGDLADAFGADLAAAHVAMPHARVSQFEIERLWDAAQNTAAPAPDADAPAVADLLRALPLLLADAPDWSAERAFEVLEAEGPEALLEQLAFETQVPLEPIRAWLADLRAAVAREGDEGSSSRQGAAAPARDPAALLGDFDPATADAALAAFDRARAEGQDFGTAWVQLLEALNLTPETDEPDPFGNRGVEPIGPASLPGLGFWVDAWAWETGQTGQPPSAAELETTRVFARFVEALHEGPTDAAEIGGTDLWAFLSGSPDPETLRRRTADLRGFLTWLREEQGADLPLEEMLAPASPRLQRLTASVAVNAALRGRRGEGLQSVHLARTSPLRVRTEGSEDALVLGFPPEAERWIRPGDALVGYWEAGAFRVAGWFPAEFQTTAHQTED